MSTRLGRNPFGSKVVSAPSVQAAPSAIEEHATTLADEPSDSEELELSSLRDFFVKDLPAAALMLALKGAARLSERINQ